VTSKLGRLARHPISTIGWTAIAWWTYWNRHQLASFGSLAATAPGRVLRHDYRDVVTEARLRSSLAADPTGRQIHHARLVVVEDGEAVIDGDPTSPDYAALARLVARHPGVRGVRQHVAAGPTGLTPVTEPAVR